MISEESLPTKSRSLRAKSIAKRLATETNQKSENTVKNAKTSKRSSSNSKHHTMSKYRRKVANAKERERMKLVSEAFDKLSNVVPVYKMMTSTPNPNDLENKNPVTKVSTLRCAISYINSLQKLIEDANRGVLDPALYTIPEDEDMNLDSNLPPNSNHTSSKKTPKNQKKKQNGKKSKKNSENSLKKTKKCKKSGFKVRQYHASDFSARVKSNFKPMSKAQLNLAIAKGLQNCKPIYTPPPPVAKKLATPPSQTGTPTNSSTPANFASNNNNPLQLIQLRPVNLDNSLDVEDYTNLEVFLNSSSNSSTISSTNSSITSPTNSSTSSDSCFSAILEDPQQIILDDIQAVLMDADNFDILV